MAPHPHLSPLCFFSPSPQKVRDSMTMYNCYCDCALGIIFVTLPRKANAARGNLSFKRAMALVTRYPSLRNQRVHRGAPPTLTPR